MKELFKKADEAGVKMVFGLEAQGHIPTIEAIIKRWEDSYKEQYPEEPLSMMYSKHVWEEIGKKIGWCSFTAALHYFEYLDSKKTKQT